MYTGVFQAANQSLDGIFQIHQRDTVGICKNARVIYLEVCMGGEVCACEEKCVHASWL